MDLVRKPKKVRALLRCKKSPFEWQASIGTCIGIKNGVAMDEEVADKSQHIMEKAKDLQGNTERIKSQPGPIFMKEEKRIRG